MWQGRRDWRVEGILGALDTRGGVHTLPGLEAQAQNSLSKPRWPLPTTSSILISPQYPLPNIASSLHTASSFPRSWTPTVVSAGPSQLQWKHYCSVPRAPVGETDKQTEFKSLCAGVSFLASLSLPFLVCNTEILMAVLFPELCEIISEALS